MIDDTLLVTRRNAKGISDEFSRDKMNEVARELVTRETEIVKKMTREQLALLFAYAPE